MRADRDLAQFDSTRAALVFALNASQVQPPGSAMNRMLAAVATSHEEPKRRKRKGVTLLVPHPDSPEGLLQAERDRQRNPRKRDRGNGPPPLAAADRPHQAGIILYHFGKLDVRHRIVLTGLCTNAHVPCECRRPCCSGWATVGQWRAAVHDTCLLLKQRGELEAVPGKKGLSTQPQLRQLVVEDYYLGRDATLVDLSSRTRVSTKTVALHRTWIREYLERTVAEAWDQVGLLFDLYGITGPWNRI